MAVGRPLRFMAFALAPMLGGCSGGVLDPAGPVAAAERTILFNSLAIMLAVAVPTIIAALVFAWWFRAGNTRAQYRPEFVYSGRIELIVWSIPTLVILFLGGIIWIGSHQLDPYRPLVSKVPPLRVQVVSLDWKWLFIYPDQGVATVNELVIPTDRPVQFFLTSGSVMNAFFVPQLGSMIYTMNGMVTQLHLQADRPGTFLGRSTMYSGDGFSDMQFNVRALPQAGFDAWAGRMRGQGGMLDRAAYVTLAQQSQNIRPYGYRAIDPQLFDAVATGHIGQGPGPEEGRDGDPEVHPRGGK